jgi:hypothetical protein
MHEPCPENYIVNAPSARVSHIKATHTKSNIIIIGQSNNNNTNNDNANQQS